MIPTGQIAQRLYDIVSRKGEDRIVEEVRFGLSYVGVKLDEQRMGLAALLLHELPHGCSVYPEAGTLAGAKATTLLKNLVEKRNPLERALGLAAANAILYAEFGEDASDSLSIMKLTPEDRVAMVGLFTPMVPKIEATGAKLSIIERDASRMAVLNKEEAGRILKDCTVAIIADHFRRRRHQSHAPPPAVREPPPSQIFLTSFVYCSIFSLEKSIIRMTPINYRD